MNTPTRRPGMKKAGDKYYVARHNLSGHWSVYVVDQWNMNQRVRDLGFGEKGSLPARRAMELRDRLQSFYEGFGAYPTVNEAEELYRSVVQEMPDSEGKAPTMTTVHRRPKVEIFLIGNLWFADYSSATPQIKEAAKRLYDRYELPLGYDVQTSPELMLEVQNHAPLAAYVEYVLREAVVA